MTSTSSTISTSAIQHIVDDLKGQRYRDSTRAIYYSVWHTFNEFFVHLDEKPSTWEERLMLFVGYLVQKQLKATTVNCYISAIKAVLRQDGVVLNEDRYLLTSLTKACRYINDRVKTRLPIQRGLCTQLVKTMEDYFQDLSQPYLAKLYTSLFATAYYGLFTVGELTAGTHPVRVTDIHVADNKNKILFVLCTSKTH